LKISLAEERNRPKYSNHDDDEEEEDDDYDDDGDHKYVCLLRGNFFSVTLFIVNNSVL
jgi:hypothetical protein